MEKNYKIDLKNNCEYIILSESMIYKILRIAKESLERCSKVKLEIIMPIEYMRYITKVINTNRENSMFRYSFISKNEITMDDIPKLMERQLHFITLDGIDCFSDIILEYQEGIPYYVLDFEPRVFKMLHDTNKEAVINIYNAGADD